MNENEQSDGNDEGTGAQNKLQNNQYLSTGSQMPGFKLNWNFFGTTKVAQTNHIWKWKNQQNSNEGDLNMMAIMNLLRESKIKRINGSGIWKTLLKHRWDIEILKTNSCLNESQVVDVIFKTGQDLKIEYGWNPWIPEEDMISWMELYSVLHYCPEKLIEAAKLSKLFESLITKENLNTVLTATMHNIQPKAGDNIKDFTAINMWYQRLDERYNFSLGEAILPLMTSESLTQLIALDPPFLQYYRAINDGLLSYNSTILGSLSISFLAN